jgi:hypothetical protein
MISLFSPERITERSFSSTPMIPKDRLHCPLRTLSLAGPLACVSFDLLQQAEETDIATIWAQKALFIATRHIHTETLRLLVSKAITSFCCFFLLFLHSVVLGVDTPYRGRVLHGKGKRVPVFVICSSFQRLLLVFGLSYFLWIFGRSIGAPGEGLLLLLFVEAALFPCVGITSQTLGGFISPSLSIDRVFIIREIIRRRKGKAKAVFHKKFKN